MGKLGASWLLSGVLRSSPEAYGGGAVLSGKRYAHGIYFSLNTGGIKWSFGLGIIIETLARPFSINKPGNSFVRLSIITNIQTNPFMSDLV